jgi:alpha-1,2-mannosyltransferase
MTTRHGTSVAAGAAADVPPGRSPVPRLVYLVIAVCTVVGGLLRLYQLARPGYLLGVTEYDDGVQFGDAVRLVSGVVPYRDFVVVQPPGSVLVMAPVAALAKGVGTAWGLAVARLVTVAADTGCVVLLGWLVRHRGPVAAGIACGVYAVYPDALVAAHTFLLEPWLNVCCLAGAVLVFDGDALSGRPRRLGWGGVVFGVAVAVKLWALVPLAVVAVLLVRWPRRLGVLAGGAAAGFGVLVLPFLALAPGALIKDVIVSQFVRDDISLRAPVSELNRLTDLAGFSLAPSVSSGVKVLALLAVAAIVPLAYLAVCLATRQLPRDLDWYAVGALVAVIVMFLWPYNYWSHYGAFAGPFIALALALPAGLLWSPASGGRMVPLLAISMVAALVIAGAGLRQFAAETKLGVSDSQAAAADQLIPAGSCAVANNISFTITADRFISDAPGCPSIVDAWGTLLAMTGGQKRSASPQVLGQVRAVWLSAFEHARYVWLQTGSQGQIPWDAGLYAYFTSHFRQAGLVNGPGSLWVPEGALYVRR